MVTMVHPDDAAKISPKIHMEIGNPWKSSRIWKVFHGKDHPKNPGANSMSQQLGVPSGKLT
jgi:hypothetical protein